MGMMEEMGRMGMMHRIYHMHPIYPILWSLALGAVMCGGFR